MTLKVVQASGLELSTNVILTTHISVFTIVGGQSNFGFSWSCVLDSNNLKSQIDVLPRGQIHTTSAMKRERKCAIQLLFMSMTYQILYYVS